MYTIWVIWKQLWLRRLKSRNRYKYENLGKHKTCLLIFFNNSLRTRLSTQEGSAQSGYGRDCARCEPRRMEVGNRARCHYGWRQERTLAGSHSGDGLYCDIIGVRSFAHFENREDDYQKRFWISSSSIRKPVFSMEAATAIRCRLFADLITIEEYKKKERPKVVLTWRHIRVHFHRLFPPVCRPDEWGRLDFHDYPSRRLRTLTRSLSVVRKVEYNQMKRLLKERIYLCQELGLSGCDPPEDYGKVLSKDMSWTVDAAVTWQNRQRFISCTVCLSVEIWLWRMMWLRRQSIVDSLKLPIVRFLQLWCWNACCKVWK